MSHSGRWLLTGEHTPSETSSVVRTYAGNTDFAQKLKPGAGFHEPSSGLLQCRGAAETPRRAAGGKEHLATRPGPTGARARSCTRLLRRFFNAYEQQKSFQDIVDFYFDVEIDSRRACTILWSFVPTLKCNTQRACNVMLFVYVISTLKQASTICCKLCWFVHPCRSEDVPSYAEQPVDVHQCMCTCWALSFCNPVRPRCQGGVGLGGEIDIMIYIYAMHVIC